MTGDERRSAFADAFIAQARSDWAIYRLLAHQQGVPVCHPLHYLQMACEKLGKAYRLRDTDAAVDELVSKHTGFEKFAASFVMIVLKDDYNGKAQQLAGVLRLARTLAREIEKLAPAVDRLAMPENTEYP